MHCKKSIELKATPSEVWDALTNFEKTKKYFFNCSVYSDWKAGSSIPFIGKIFLVKKIQMSGTILEVEQEKILKYNLGNGDGESQSIVTDQLSFENGQTTLSISDDVGSGEGAEKRYHRSLKGWDTVLKGLKKVVEE